MSVKASWPSAGGNACTLSSAPVAPPIEAAAPPGTAAVSDVPAAEAGRDVVERATSGAVLEAVRVVHLDDVLEDLAPRRCRRT